MSISLMTAAFKSTLPTTQKFVFVALCDNANDQGECYPSITMLCEKTSLSERAVQGAIKYLVENGFLCLSMRKGRSTYYYIKPSEQWPAVIHSPRRRCTPAGDAPPQEMHPTPAGDAPPPPQEMHPTPAPRAPITINEPSIEPSGNRKYNVRNDLCAKGVIPQIIDDWLTLRKTKRAAVTATAVDGIEREAEKAGVSLNDALKMCCEQGWQGFKAEWVAIKNDVSHGSQKKTIYEQNREAGKRAKEMLFGVSHD